MFSRVPGYEHLEQVLIDAYNQASRGKGAERHANDLPFHEQRMQQLSTLLDSDRGMAFQVGKKMVEGMDFVEYERFERELLGCIVYLAGIIVRRKLSHQAAADLDAAFDQVMGVERAANNLTDFEPIINTRTIRSAPELAAPYGETDTRAPEEGFRELALEHLNQASKLKLPEGFHAWAGGTCPFNVTTELYLVTRGGTQFITRAGNAVGWQHVGDANDIVGYYEPQPLAVGTV